MICITLCEHCGTLLEYNMTQQKIAILNQRTIDELTKVGGVQFLMMRMLSVAIAKDA